MCCTLYTATVKNCPYFITTERKTWMLWLVPQRVRVWNYRLQGDSNTTISGSVIKGSHYKAVTWPCHPDIMTPSLGRWQPLSYSAFRSKIWIPQTFWLQEVQVLIKSWLFLPSLSCAFSSITYSKEIKAYRTTFPQLLKSWKYFRIIKTGVL